MSSLRAQYGRAFSYIRPYWRRLAAVAALGLVGTLVSLVQPYISKLLIDEALQKRDMDALAAVAALMVGVTVLGFALSVLSSYQYVKVSAEALFDMRLAVYRRLQELSPRFYARTRMGDIVSRINNDIAEVQRVSADSLLALAGNIVFLAGSAAIMLWLDWRLFLISISLLPVSALALHHYQRRLTGQVRTLRERSADIGSFLVETLLGMRLVTASGAEAHEVARFRARNQGFISALLAMQRTSYLAGALPGAILALSTAALLLYGGRLVIEGALTIGSLVAFMAYHLRLLAPVQGMLGLYSSLVTASVSLGRVFELLDTPVEVREKPDAAPLGEVRGDIEFDNVVLRHDRDAPVLDGVTFCIPSGSITAVVGPSGAGKSTIADMLIRLYDPDSGAVRLDGRDLRDLRLDDLRRAIALVDQAPYLFHASVRENIAYARPEATKQEIEAVARSAAIHDFILSLPDGYETVVGERGLALSAGERQRIAIARALLRGPAVLVLDEPSAALDAENERALAKVIAGRIARTVVVITHRRALMQIADQVIEIRHRDTETQSV